MGDSNSRPDGPKPPALPTALIPDIRFFCMILCGEGKSKFFVSVGSAVVKAGFAGGSSGGGFPPQATVPRTSGLSLLGEWIDRLSSQSRRATNCATPRYEVVGLSGRFLPKRFSAFFIVVYSNLSSFLLQPSYFLAILFPLFPCIPALSVVLHVVSGKVSARIPAPQ